MVQKLENIIENIGMYRLPHYCINLESGECMPQGIL